MTNINIEKENFKQSPEKQDLFFWGTIFYLFLEIVGPQNVYSILETIRIQLLVIAILIVVSIFQYKRRIFWCAENSLIILLMAAFFISTMFALNFDAAWQVTYDYFKLVIYYFVIIYCIKNNNSLKSYIICLFLMISLYILLSFREYLHGQHVYDMGVIRMLGWDRRLSPNRLGILCAISIPLSFLMLKEEVYTKLFLFGKNIMPAKFLKLLAYITMVVSIINIFLTNSRTSLLLLCFYCLTLFFRLKRKILLAVFVALLVPLIVSNLPEETIDRYMSIVYDLGLVKRKVPMTREEEWTEASAQGRLFGLKRGMEIFMEYPVFGVGPGGFQYISGNNLQAHNLLGQVASETGIVGLVTFSFLILTSYRKFRKAKDKIDKKGRTIAPFWIYTKIAFKDILNIMLISSIFAHTLFYSWWLIFFSIGALGNKYATDSSN